MVRPRSSSKVPKQRGGSDSGKRKRGGVPNAGGGGGRPAKQSRREGKSKPVDRDIYEAEDSDPDEVKHAERFDKVDNYEYELPSDFEDEEIDEELAFTEEDKKKFGSWFEKEVDADEDDDGGTGIGNDGDSDDWDDDEGDEGEEGDDEDEDGGRRPRNRGGAAARTAAGADDGDDLFLGGDDEDAEEEDDDDDLEGFEEDDEDEDVEGDQDDERHRAMLRAVLAATSADGGRDGGWKRTRRDPNAAVVSEAYPESEYNLNPGAASAGGAAGSLSVADLLQGLTSEERRKLGSARRLLEKVAGSGSGAAAGGAGADGKASGKGLRPVAVPLPAVVAERQERKAGYEAASEEVAKWQSIVKANREAPTLRLISSRDEVPRVTTTAALVAQHTPSADNALEAEVAALLEAAGAANTEALEEAEEKLALKALSLEEAKERRNRLAKMRALLFYHEVKARRLKAIKSKEYHRHLARAAKRKAAKLAAAAAEAGDGGDGEPGKVDAERAAAIEAEYQWAKERLTQRHRNSSRWARRALKRGQLQIDEGTKAALAEQLQLGQQLKRKIEGKKGDGSDSEGDDDSEDVSTSASEGEEGAKRGEGSGRHPGARVRSAALDLLAGGGSLELEGDNAPKKGLLALPFMKRAMERRRLAAQQEAEQLLRELDEQQALARAEGADEDGDGDAADGMGTAGAGGLIEALVGYGAPLAAADVSGAGGRRKFGGGGGGGGAADDAADQDDQSDVESDDAEDADAKAARLGRKPRAAAAAAAAAAAVGKKGRKAGASAAAAAAAPPTAADEADLDAAIAAGAAGRGLLVSSSDLAGDDDRRNSGRHASTRAGTAAAAAAAAANGTGGGILEEVAALQGSMAAGGGRAALFKGAATKTPSAAEPAFVAAKKFAGAKPGYAFKKGSQGLGYYRDGAAGTGAAATAAADGEPGGKGKGKGKGRQQQQEPKLKQGNGAASAPVVVAGQTKQTVQQQPQPGQKQQQQRGGQGQQQNAAAAAAAAAANGTRNASGGADGDDDDDDDDNTPMMRPVGADPKHQQLQQRDLIRQAFAGDDVEAEFAAEKAAAVAEELPKVDEPSTLPGWGAWATQQRNPKWMQAAKDKAAKIRADAAASRKDANLKYVVITEKYDKKAVKYTAPTAPFPFTSQEAYERSLRQPLGREYNPDAAFRDLTRPAVLKQAGVTIAPLRFSEPMAKELGRRSKKAEAERESRRVVTVAGGMIKKGKAAK